MGVEVGNDGGCGGGGGGNDGGGANAAIAAAPIAGWFLITSAIKSGVRAERSRVGGMESTGVVGTGAMGTEGGGTAAEPPIFLPLWRMKKPRRMFSVLVCRTIEVSTSSNISRYSGSGSVGAMGTR